MDETLNKIKQFESTLKRLLLETFGKFLPEDKVSLLNASTYTSPGLLALENSAEVRQELLNRMLDDLIDMSTLKTITLEDGNTINLYYGSTLEETIINYYSKQIADKYHFDIGEIDGLDEDVETVKALYAKLGDSFDYSAFNEDAVKLLTKADIKEITEKYDQKEVDEYFSRVKKVAGIGELSKQEQINMLRQSTNRDLSMQIVWLHDKKHIKYTDPYGKVHLMDISNSPKLEEFFKKRIATLMPDEKLDPEKFFRELQDYANQIELMSTNDVKEDELNSKQVDMLEFVKTAPALNNMRKQDIVRHNSAMDIHVLQGDNTIVTTKDKDDHVEAQIISDGSAEMTDSVSQASSDISSKLISKEEYIRLNTKLFNGEQLSEQELEALRRAAPVYSEEVFDDMQEKENKGGTALKPKNNYNTGFTLKTFALYFVVLTILIATIFGIIVLR